MKFILAALAMVFLGTTAAADQCQRLSYNQASKAASMLRGSGAFYYYCPSCGDRIASLHNVAFTQIEPQNEGGYELAINGYRTDLAYVYLSSGSNRNVGHAVGCANSQPQYLP